MTTESDWDEDTSVTEQRAREGSEKLDRLLREYLDGGERPSVAG